MSREYFEGCFNGERGIVKLLFCRIRAGVMETVKLGLSEAALVIKAKCHVLCP